MLLKKGKNKKTNYNKPYFIPVYINNPKLLDINSEIYDGYAKFSEVIFKSKSESRKSTNANLGGDINIKIFEIDSGIGTTRSSETSNSSTISLKKTQTSSSLLSNTLNSLEIQGRLVKNPSKVGQFAELKLIFKNNSLDYCLNNFINLAKLNIIANSDNNGEKYANDAIDKLKKVKETITNNENIVELYAECGNITYVIKLNLNYLYNAEYSDIYNKELSYFVQVKNIYPFGCHLLSDTNLKNISDESINKILEMIKSNVGNKQISFDFDLKTRADKTVIELDTIACYRKSNSE